jgi:hypothetical protein
MRAVRQCLSLTLTILCFGVIDSAWFEAAFAEGSTTSLTGSLPPIASISAASISGTSA